ncbi:MmpS family transport accessory protein [Nocardia arthritidis]|uniref:Transport acessory protein MmpS n=1 Tax=Nocardia arthritidis TaxID=228602 RepID=A0A6G9YBR4_9NOCA|nr:MmpS family transport accessory protein [Nocardia arthritidis]QIS10453.1 hypothetical protein F5544_12820 [Nocardia arthritidis]
MKSVWVYGVVIAVLGLTAVFIADLRLSRIPDLAIGYSNPPPSFGRPREKVVDYEVDGPVGASATLSYIDANGEVQDVAAALPWRISLRTNRLTMPTGLVAQSDAQQVSCRIVINGQARDSRASNAPSAAVNCNVLVS